MKVLVKFSCDWADEFQCEEFKIVEVDSINDAKQQVLDDLTEWDDEVYFGTNECFEKDELDINSDYTFQELTEQQATVLIDLFGQGGSVQFGTGIL